MSGRPGAAMPVQEVDLASGVGADDRPALWMSETPASAEVWAAHFAFCPDNIWQGCRSDLAGYAERLIGAPTWSFWWD